MKLNEKWILFLIATIVTFSGIWYSLFKETSANEVPANSAFDDMNFYMCVVDAYNQENQTNVEYSYSLSDEELASISSLVCHGWSLSDDEKIISVNGLDKLTSLTELSISGHLLTEIDFSNNNNLQEINVSNNQLTELIVNKNLELLQLSADRNQLTTLDVSNNLKLQGLDVGDNKLAELNLDKNLDLLVLYANSNQLSTLNISNNLKLQGLDVCYNQLTSIDISNNEDLVFLAVEENQLSELNLNSNVLLQQLYVSENQLVELDLSNNTELVNFSSSLNPMDGIFNVYKDKNVTVDSSIKFPENLDLGLFTWESDNIEIATVDENGVVTALNGGTTYTMRRIESDIFDYYIGSIINVIDITSDVYAINEENDFIYVGLNEFNVDNVNVVGHSINVDNNKLQFLYSDDLLIHEMDILSIDLGTLNYGGNVINLDNELSYDDFVRNLSKSDELDYKILTGSEVVTSGNIASGMVLEITYDDIVIDSYEINIVDGEFNLTFSETLSIDTDNKYINYVVKKTTVEDLLAKVSVDGGSARIYDIDNVEKEATSVVATGDKLVINIDDVKVDEYTISVLGDSNGDGNVGVLDLVQMRKLIVEWVDPNTNEVYKKSGVYYNALDLDKNGNVGMIDLVKLRKLIVE